MSNESCPYCGGEGSLQPIGGSVLCDGCHLKMYGPRYLSRTEGRSKKAVSNKLLPCPFCGGEGIIQPIGGSILCAGCHLEVYGPKQVSRVEGWNKRVSSPDVRELRDDALRHEGRADYFASLLTRLLATRQGRTVGYEPPEVQALWREVDEALEEKEGVK